MAQQPLLDQTNISEEELKPSILGTNNELRHCIFQAIGTCILTVGICGTSYATPIEDKVPNPFHNMFIALSLYLAICFCAPFCGAHFNPSVSLGFWFRGNNSLNSKFLGIYVLGQFMGGAVGVVISKFILDSGSGPYADIETIQHLVKNSVGELMGTFLFTFCIFIVTTQATTFISQDSWIHIFIPIFLFISRTFSYKVGGLNPAVIIPLQFANFFQNDYRWQLILYGILISLGSLWGACFSGIFFERVYCKTIKKWKGGMI